MQLTAPAKLPVCLHAGKPWDAISDSQPGEARFKGTPAQTTGAAGTVQPLIGLATTKGGSGQPIGLWHGGHQLAHHGLLPRFTK